MENIKPEDINVLNKIDSTCTSNIVETRVQGTLSKIDDGSAVIKYADSSIQNVDHSVFSNLLYVYDDYPLNSGQN